MSELIVQGTSHNSVRQYTLHQVFGPDLVGPALGESFPTWETAEDAISTKHNRYVVEASDDEFVVRDTHNGELIRTGTGRVYAAPFNGAQFTADTLNKRGDWSKTGQ